MLSRRLLRIKVVKALYAHFKSESDSLIVSEKNLNFSIDKTYQLYHLLLELIVDVRQYAARKAELGRQKLLPTPEDLNPNLKFVRNRAVERIAESEELKRYLEAHSLSWSNYPELIRKLYQNMTGREYYTEYMNNGKDSFTEDVKFLMNFFTSEVEDFDPLYDILEEQSIYWADDVEFALIMVVRTLHGMKEKEPQLRLLPRFKNEDDRKFAGELFRNALVNHRKYSEYIDTHTRNWDLERIAYMDRVIMLAPIAELLSCPTIPVKVTLDEYIEIAKYYSTPASSTFINGVLDKIVEKLRADGMIDKQGRGLVES